MSAAAGLQVHILNFQQAHLPLSGGGLTDMVRTRLGLAFSSSSLTQRGFTAWLPCTKALRRTRQGFFVGFFSRDVKVQSAFAFTHLTPRNATFYHCTEQV